MISFSFEKSMPPIRMPIGGMMMSLTSEVTILPNAPPITTATARSTTLPRMMKALKSFAKLIAFSFRGVTGSPLPCRGVHLGTLARHAQAAARSDDASFEYRNPLQVRAEVVAARQGSDACRRAGEDQVAGLQFEQFRELRDDLGDRENHVRDVGVLARAAVDGQRQPRVRGMPDVACGAQRGDRRGSIKALGDIPRQALRLHRGLQIAAGQIQAHAVTEYAIACMRGGDVASAAGQRH